MVARILVVEEHAESLVAMLHALKGRGYSTVFSTDAAAIVSLAKDERPDLVVCAWRPSCDDGREVVQPVLKDERLRGVPRLALLDDPGFDLVGGRRTPAGFVDHVAKPIDPEVFLRTVERHLPKPLRASREAPRPRGQRRKTDSPVWRSDS
jgi:two-component system cell cycle response regulator